MEVLVVVAIIAVLSLMSAALGGQWANDSHVTQGQAVLQQGYAVTKAMALQNVAAATGSDAASVLCFNKGSLNVVVGDDCTSKAVWHGEFPAKASFTLGGAVPACLALTNSGALLPKVGSTDCTTSLTYSISSGDSNVSNKTLY